MLNRMHKNVNRNNCIFDPLWNFLLPIFHHIIYSLPPLVETDSTYESASSSQEGNINLHYTSVGNKIKLFILNRFISTQYASSLYLCLPLTFLLKVAFIAFTHIAYNKDYILSAVKRACNIKRYIDKQNKVIAHMIG